MHCLEPASLSSHHSMSCNPAQLKRSKTRLIVLPALSHCPRITQSTSQWLSHPSMQAGKMPIQVFLPVLKLGCLSFWYWVQWAIYMFLDINPLSVTYYLQIFSPISVANLWGFFLSIVSFAVQKLLSLIKSRLFLLLFSSRSFMISGLTFRSILSLFLYMVWDSVLISFFSCSCPVYFSAQLNKETVFPRCLFLSPLL